MAGSDPWRYRCPECESTNVRKRIALDQAKEVIEDTSFKKQYKTTPNRWYCDGCRTPFKRPADAETGHGGVL